MFNNHDSGWLETLSRRLRRFAIPVATTLTALQITGFVIAYAQPDWIENLVLDPQRVLDGEIWRVLSFLAMPVSLSIIGFLFSVVFGYFIINSVELAWGQTKTTLYAAVSIFLTIIFSLVFRYPIASIADLGSTFFLAAAALFPEQEIRIYYFIPVKMKVMGWLALAFVVYQFINGMWLDRLYLTAVYSNYLLFFGPSLIYQAKQWKRRRDFKANFR